MTGMECSRLHDLAPELALGLLDGAERAEALAHLERCAKCHADVASLTELGEQMLLLAPEVPPPAGFESRVLARVELAGLAGLAEGAGPADEAGPVDEPRSRSRWWARRALGVAAALLLVGVVAGVVLTLAGGDEPEVVASASMETAQGRPIGSADLLEGSPPTVRIDLAEWAEQVEAWDDPPEGPWHLAVYDDSGRMETYELPYDDPTPDVRLSHGVPATVHHVSVVDGEGRVWCTAEFG